MPMPKLAARASRPMLGIFTSLISSPPPKMARIIRARPTKNVIVPIDQVIAHPPMADSAPLQRVPTLFLRRLGDDIPCKPSIKARFSGHAPYPCRPFTAGGRLRPYEPQNRGPERRSNGSAAVRDCGH